MRIFIILIEIRFFNKVKLFTLFIHYTVITMIFLILFKGTLCTSLLRREEVVCERDAPTTQNDTFLWTVIDVEPPRHTKHRTEILEEAELAKFECFTHLDVQLDEAVALYSIDSLIWETVQEENRITDLIGNHEDGGVDAFLI